MKIRVTVWNEYVHEKINEEVRNIYPSGIHGTIAGFLGKEQDIVVRTATLDEPEHGLTDEVLDETDVLIWWGHAAHDKVDDVVVDRIQNKVLCGMGLIVLHSGHHSKIFKRLMGTTCNLKWREADERERLWLIEPSHPIADGVDECTVIEQEEMYGERFDIPEPDTTVFIGWFKGGEVFRSGCCFTRGYGKIFYFQPGHETYPIFRNEKIQKIICNAARWATPLTRAAELVCPHVSVPPEKI